MSKSDYLRWLAAKGGVTRRDFLNRAAALGVSTALASSLASKAVLAEETPRRGGHLKLGLDGASSTDSLDPGTYFATYMYTVGYQWGNCLMELDENNQAVPELAESWEPNADATQWVFKLRRGVEFHNGKEMTAADVVYSLNHHLGENTRSGAHGLLQSISEVKATGKHEVTVTLKAANADMPYVTSDYHLLIMPEGGNPAAGIGTGPYVIDTFDPGVRTLATRNPNYWKEGRAHVDTVETLAINDRAARTSALQTGSVHLINNVDPKTVSLLEPAPTVEIVNVPGAGHYTFPMLCNTPPFDNNDLRLALKFAMDREELVAKVLRGYGEVGNDHPISRFDPFYAADLPQHAYDPDKARHHFQKAGIEEPITLYISDAAFAGAEDSAILFREHAAKADIVLNVERMPEDGYWSDVWKVKPFFGSYWAGRATADMMLSAGYLSDSAWNEGNWRRADFDKLLLAARAELNTDKRKQMYHDLQEMIWRDGSELIPMFNNFIFAQQKGLAGFVRAPVFTGFRVAEQLYFTS